MSHRREEEEWAEMRSRLVFVVSPTGSGSFCIVFVKWCEVVYTFSGYGSRRGATQFSAISFKYDAFLEFNKENNNDDGKKLKELKMIFKVDLKRGI